MFVVDFLILNRDRHGANIEILRNSKKKTIRPAPLFDHGLSLLFQCMNEKEIASFDVMEDRLTNTYIGSRSVLDNLKLIPPDALPEICPLKPQHKAILLEGLEDILPQSLLKKIWEMIWKRWCVYEDFCNTR
ncbi:MAG: hypothetical protein LUE90_03665 [Clostridiales bacterium]|nr:hypothetical protein [Clostridiales bacterium]